MKKDQTNKTYKIVAPRQSLEQNIYQNVIGKESINDRKGRTVIRNKKLKEKIDANKYHKLPYENSREHSDSRNLKNSVSSINRAKDLYSHPNRKNI